MSYKGRITEWKDDRGFGFIAPVDGGSKTFVHISSFASRGRRPKENDLVTYTLAADPKGRARAVRVKYISDNAQRLPGNRQAVRAIVVASTFFALLGSAVVMGGFPVDVWAFYVTMSFVAFVMYWHDKSASHTGRWRTRERTLHILGLLGGWPGALVAMQFFRHKSSKQSFRNVFWATVAANCVVLAWLKTSTGASLLGSVLGVT